MNKSGESPQQAPYPKVALRKSLLQQIRKFHIVGSRLSNKIPEISQKYRTIKKKMADLVMNWI